MPCRSAITSMSLGRAWVHDLRHKLEQASQAGFEGIEIFYEDLEYLAKTYGDLTDHDNVLAAARDIRNWCTELNLTIIGLQPFAFYEGLLDRTEHTKRIEKLHLWFDIVKILQTDIIQIPTNFLQDGITGDMEIIVQDMLELAKLGLQQDPVVKFAYENLAWGTYIDSWEQAWEVVRRVDRPNFGMCLDTFNICGRVYGDPAVASGKTPNAKGDMDESIERLVKTIDVRKVFYVQIVDAERLDSPLVEGHFFYVEGQPARMSWSRNARLFAYEGGYLPILKVAEAVFKELGFDGWVSMELFSRTLTESDPGVPESHARRGIGAWRSLVEEFEL